MLVAIRLHYQKNESLNPLYPPKMLQIGSSNESSSGRLAMQLNDCVTNLRTALAPRYCHRGAVVSLASCDV